MSSQTYWASEHYDRFSKVYDPLFRLFFPIGEKARRSVLSDLQKGSSILDVACGTGSLLKLAHAAGLACFGIDSSEGMLRKAASKVPGVELQITDFFSIPYADDAFDYVVETNALSGVATQLAVSAVVAEMVRVCKPGGEIRIGDYAAPPDTTRRTRWIENIMHLFGDYPHPYAAILERMKCYVTYEAIGWRGLYQYIKAKVP